MSENFSEIVTYFYKLTKFPISNHLLWELNINILKPEEYLFLGITICAWVVWTNFWILTQLHGNHQKPIAANEIKQGKGIKGMQIRRKDIKQSLFMEDMIIYVKNMRELIKTFWS